MCWIQFTQRMRDSLLPALQALAQEMKKGTISIEFRFGLFAAELFKWPVSEFNEFEPRLKSAKNRFQLSAVLTLEKLNTILSGTNQN